ncbi:redoxin domain-containing protein [Mariniblastus fucicola]|uniref:Peroxiredoxin n=1 Tax=Mariniblastus fucicola TaxID=980251 RepID=A0A5B9PA55_9BACT|nr:redoxin domain-containing protein [Mariniblastus fucicola]QEG23667.1 Putative peroxiredoxin [Mariniblastus fucicola]
MQSFVLRLVVVVLLICFQSETFAQQSSNPDGFTKLNIGDAAPDFDLPGVDDKNHKLADYADKKVLMVVFTCNHCPTAQAYEERLNKMVEDYAAKGVAIVGISPNDPKAVRLDELGYSDLGDTLEDMKIRAREAGFKFPYLFDGETQKVSLSYGVLATPHVFIFDAERKLRYKGRIDDSEEGNPKVHDARNAIDALLADKAVPVETTRVFGCSTKWFTKREDHKRYLAKWDKEPVSLSVIDLEKLKAIAANDTDKLRVVNVWATWCGPCLEELPEFVTINRMYRGRKFEMVTVSVDELKDQDKALRVLTKTNVSCRNVLFNSGKRDELFETLDPEWEGGFPYTAIYAPGGKVVFRKQGQIDPTELKQAIADRVGRTFASDKVEISESAPATKPTPGDNFKTGNLVPWCTVAFDSKKRSPEDRAKMIFDLGLKRSAYAWRERHLKEFEREILAYKANGIEYFTFFNWHPSMEPLIRKHGIKPQIWHYMQFKPSGTQEEKVVATAEHLKKMVDKTRELGLKFALYNHGGWTGDPANMVAVVKHIRATQPDSDHVGIVYNFHHGHGDVEDFEARFNVMLPYLYCVNLNGMVEPQIVNEETLENKILTIGEGKYEADMIRTVIASGYAGPIGIIDHRDDLDSEIALRDNMLGLKKLLSQLYGSAE